MGKQSANDELSGFETHFLTEITLANQKQCQNRLFQNPSLTDCCNDTLYLIVRKRNKENEDDDEDDYEDDDEDDDEERFDAEWAIASECTCGTWVKKEWKIHNVADCICGAG